MTKLNDLENIAVLKSDTYDCSGTNYTNVEQPRFNLPFENQSTFGQRYNVKGFDVDKPTEKAQNYYELKPILPDDIAVADAELKTDGTYYHHPFPTSDNKEDFITHPYESGQNVEDTWSSGMIPVSGSNVPEIVESFESTGKSITIIVIIVILVLLALAIVCYFLKKKQPVKTNVDVNTAVNNKTLNDEYFDEVGGVECVDYLIENDVDYKGNIEDIDSNYEYSVDDDFYDSIKDNVGSNYNDFNDILDEDVKPTDINLDDETEQVQELYIESVPSKILPENAEEVVETKKDEKSINNAMTGGVKKQANVIAKKLNNKKSGDKPFNFNV